MVPATFSRTLDRPVNAVLPLDGRCALVVEDEFLIADCLIDELESLGFDTAGPFISGAEALAWLTSNTPDFAVVDVLLKDGYCLDLARELRTKSVPILFYTGLFDWPPFHREFADAHVLHKPAAMNDLSDALDRLLAPKTGSPVPVA